MSNRRTLRDQLIRARNAAGMTVPDAAAALGVDPSTLRNWEAGLTRPVAKYAAAVERAFGIDCGRAALMDVTSRECLRCRTEFLSWGAGNRMCGPCRVMS